MTEFPSHIFPTCPHKADAGRLPGALFSRNFAKEFGKFYFFHIDKVSEWVYNVVTDKVSE